MPDWRIGGWFRWCSVQMHADGIVGGRYVVAPCVLQTPAEKIQNAGECKAKGTAATCRAVRKCPTSTRARKSRKR